MKLRYAILAEDIKELGGGRQSIERVVDTITAQSFPARLSLTCLNMKFDVERSEQGKTHNLVVRLVDRNGSDIIDPNTFPFVSKSPSNPPLDLFQLIAITLRIEGILIPNEGLYCFKIYVNEDHLGDAPFYVEREQVSQGG